MHELPLVFFTVFTQSAVGAFILLLIGGALGQIDARRRATGLFAMMCLFGLGVVIGIFHIGQPLRALNMLFRIGHSPMSNEIVLSAAFAALGGLGSLGLLLNRGATALCNVLVWLPLRSASPLSWRFRRFTSCRPWSPGARLTPRR
jgi:anaerobic dimethyl sulfoxide reductase subunit C (anchor subunit)